MNGHFKIIFWVNLYQLKELCIPEDLNKKHAVSCPVSPMKGHFMTIFWAELYQLKKLHLPRDAFYLQGDLNNEHPESSSRTLPTKGVLSSRRHSTFRTTWTITWVFPTVSENSHFRTIFSVHLLYWLKEL